MAAATRWRWSSFATVGDQAAQHDVPQRLSQIPTSIPGGTELGGNLWYMFLGGTAPGEMERFFAHSPQDDELVHPGVAAGSHLHAAQPRCATISRRSSMSASRRTRR